MYIPSVLFLKTLFVRWSDCEYTKKLKSIWTGLLMRTPSCGTKYAWFWITYWRTLQLIVTRSEYNYLYFRYMTSFHHQILFLANAHIHLYPFTPKNDQFQIPPAASREILHHTIWRTIISILTTSLIHFSLKSWENVLFLNLGVKGFKRN